jgi:hypothetical protein
MKKHIVLASAILAAAATTASAQAPSGGEFRVNTYTTDYQYRAAVASDGSGNFVVVWTSHNQAPDAGYGVRGQRFNASGVPQGVEFQVNTYTTNTQGAPQVTSDPNGNFVVVWSSYSQDGSSNGVFGQRFNAAGARQGGEFRVNTYTTGLQFASGIASDAAGNFVVVWHGPNDGSYFGVLGQRFNASGVAQGGEFRVNTYTTGYQFLGTVAMAPNGTFVVAWTSYGQDGDYYGVFGQRFNAAGVKQGSEFRVNTYTTDYQILPAVASDPNGNFVVAWESFGQDGSAYGIFGQRFNAAGVKQGGEFRVNTYSTDQQYFPGVAVDEKGNFVVTWSSYAQDGSDYGVFGQRFNAAGAPQGAEFQVNTATLSYQKYPTVAGSPDGDFVVVWSSLNQDGSAAGAFGQRYGDIIFEDGFDSGDLSRWTSASTGGGDLSTSGAAAMAGTSTGMQALVNDTTSLFVQDDSPNAETRYRVRFYFDPNGFDPGEADSHFRTRILIAFDQAGLRAITLVLKRQLGAYTVEARVKRNDGTRADTGFFPITDGPHFLEFDWQRSTGPGASNGTLQFFIDDVSMTTLTAIDNDQSVIESVRMGVLSIKTAANGIPFYDQFESRRLRQIGAE